MESLDYWRLCEELSVIQAALLIVDENPSEYMQGGVSFPKNAPKAFEAALSALKNSIRSGLLKATIRKQAFQLYAKQLPHPYREGFVDSKGNKYDIEYEPLWGETYINVSDLTSWLEGRGFKTGFFFTNIKQIENFLNKNNEFYAPKLAAAYSAWKVISSNPSLMDGKTPKQALEKWLREHANEYGLTKDDGNPNETGIDDICKIANWKPEGGAARTPTQVPKNSTTPKKLDKKAHLSVKVEKSTSH